jgi:Uma2 family endonuclease
VSALPKPFITPEQYLESERKADFRSEYYRGEMLSRAGATEAHNLLVSNSVRELSQHFRTRPCRVYPSDMRVRVNAASYTYPDVVAVCGKSEFLDDETDTLLNPTLLIEVLSRSTEAYDRGRKFEQYKAIQSLREYLLLASDRVHADLYTRLADGRWILTSADRLDDSLPLESVGAQLTLSDLYEKVGFSELLAADSR